MPHQTVAATPNDSSINYPPSNQAPRFNPQNAYMPHQTPTLHSILNPSPNQETAPSLNPQHASMPHIQTPTYQHISNNPIPNYPPISEPIPSFNAPQPIPSNHPPTYLPINETVPSFNAPQNSHIPQAVAHEPINPNVPIPNFPPKAETFQNTNASAESTPKADQPTQVKTRGIMHFSHPHSLRLVNLKDGEDFVACSACKEIISDSGYSCPKSSCNFHLDKSCFRLAQEIEHKSHPEHPLTLLSSSSDEYGTFICSACSTDCVGFTYHCASCEFNLHVKCASSPETVKRKDHEHPLNLVYSCPITGEGYAFFCDVCGGVAQENCWTYCCRKCDYGTHVGCVNCEANPAEESSSSTGNPVLDAQLHVLDAQMQMQRLQLQMEMGQQRAQMMMRMGQSSYTSI